MLKKLCSILGASKKKYLTSEPYLKCPKRLMQVRK